MKVRVTELCERFQLCLAAADQEGVGHVLVMDELGFAAVRGTDGVVHRLHLPWLGGDDKGWAEIDPADEVAVRFASMVCPIKAIQVLPRNCD